MSGIGSAPFFAPPVFTVRRPELEYNIHVKKAGGGGDGMPANPRLTGHTTKTETPKFRSPEEEELDHKRVELERFQSELAESELQLATLRSELVAFERRYLEVVGSRYAELDRLEAQTAEAIARRDPQNPSARQKADAAQRTRPGIGRSDGRRWPRTLRLVVSSPPRNSRRCTARQPRNCIQI